MDAKEAKAQASLNKQQKEDSIEHKALLAKKTDSSLLLNHLLGKVEEAVKGGHLSTTGANQVIEFPVDRFTNEVITNVVDQLRIDGYNVVLEKQNAYGKYRFLISWNE